ncbi:MAG: hypothetical protein P8013_07490 [Candidatus Sulfobium sp.]|jgi:hypothetical protein
MGRIIRSSPSGVLKSATPASACRSRNGLGAGDNPVFKGVFEWSRLVAGASLQAADLFWPFLSGRSFRSIDGYMRMYWSKKILDWSRSPEEAMATAISLNDRYELDGRDPNGYAGVAWSIGGVHDRA